MADQAYQASGRGFAVGQGDPKAIPIPPDVRRRTERGRNQMKRDAAKRRLCARFERGDTFTYLDEKGALQERSLITNPRGGGKPPHRIRNRYNFIRPIVEDKVSAATQRVPSFEVDPATTDPEDAGAAKMSEKVAIYGYDQWRYRQATVDAVKTAIGMGGSACALPYFDPNVGPYTQVEERWVGQGEIRIRVYNGNEHYWEPGTVFDASPWWATEQAQPIDGVMARPGYAGGKLVPDASTWDIPNERRADAQLVMVTEYYERPSPRWPSGRWLTIANGRVIVDNRRLNPVTEWPWQDYPLRDADGQVIDEPLLHRLVYTHDPDDDDDLGLTWQLIDFQRSAQDCLNKMMEYKNRGLNLQMLAPVNSLIDSPDDVPAAVRYYRLSPNGEKPNWEDPPSGQILNALLQIFNVVVDQMKSIAAYEDIHADPNVAARTTAAVIEQSIARWQSFLGDLAEWHSRLMRHCLLLVARYYTEPRALEVRGRMGWESYQDFRGAHLLGQANVRVSPGSLEYWSKAQVLSKVQYYASMGWVSGQQAMAAIEGGQAEKITESHDLDVAKVNRIIQKIRNGTIMDMPTRSEMIEIPDPVTGQPMPTPHEVPAWMPDDYDDVDVWQEQLANWLKTDDFENSPPHAQEVGKLMWQGLKQLKAQQANEAAAQQQQMAQSLGMGNAAAPQGPPSLPSQPNITGPGPQPAQPQ
jgi:hypothetical protein